MGSAKLRRDDVRDMVSAGATFPGNPHLTSHFQMSSGGMFIMTRAGAASDSGVRGGGGGGGGREGSTTNCSRLLSDFVRSRRALAEEHLQLAHGK